MTREQAIEIWSMMHGMPARSALAERGIDTYVALGMLKLEEPKSAREKFQQVLTDKGFYLGSVYVSAALDAFDESQK